MKKWLAILAILFLTTSCEEEEKPAYVLNYDQMVSILIDIHISEGIASSLPIDYDSSKVVYNLLEMDVFSKHGVTDSVFTHSLLYYLQDPPVMDYLYARVVDSLSMKQTVRESERAKK